MVQHKCYKLKGFENLDTKQKRGRMSRLDGVGGQGRVRRLGGGLVVGVTKHYERVDALADDILWGVVRTKGH
jgi:hypothetical protein